MVRFLLKNNPDLTICDKFGKKIYERAKTKEIARMITQNSVSLVKSQSSASLLDRQKNLESVDALKMKTMAKKEFKKMAENNGPNNTLDITKAYMQKMKEKIGEELSQEISKIIEEQFSGVYADLQKFLGQNFFATSGNVFESSLKLFNIKLQDALKKQGIELAPEMLLSNEDINNAIYKQNEDILYTEPNNNTLIDTIKLLSKTPIKKDSKKLLKSPKTNLLINCEENKELGIPIMSYIGGLFNKMSQELIQNLSVKIAKDVKNNIDILKATFIASNQKSFDRLSKEMQSKITNILNEKFVRITKSMTDKIRKEETTKAKNSLLNTCPDFNFEPNKSNLDSTTRSRMDLYDKFRMARTQRKLRRSVDNYEIITTPRLSLNKSPKQSFATSIKKSIKFASPKKPQGPINMQKADPHCAKIKPVTACSDREQKIQQITRKQAYLMRTLNPPPENYNQDTSTYEKIHKLNMEESSTFNRLFDSLSQKNGEIDSKNHTISSGINNNSNKMLIMNSFKE